VRYELVREREQLVAGVRPALLVLSGAAIVLLLIACLNVANLLLARAVSRDRELALRAALGASRGRLLRQSLTESLLLGLLGGVVGAAVAVSGLSAFRALATPLARIDLGTTGVGWGAAAFPRLGEVALDLSQLGATAIVAIVAALAVGLAAALRAARASVFDLLRGAGATASAGGRRGGRLRAALVVLQVAGALALLVGAVGLARSLRGLTTTDPGFTSTNVVTFQVALPPAAYPDARLQAFAEALAERIKAVPGVVHAGYANQVPMVALRDTAGGLWSTPDAKRAFAPDAADARFVSRGYLPALGVPILAGRGFEPRDGAGQPRVLVINQALARRQFAGRDPVGLTVYVGRDERPWTIVGVVGDIRQFGLDRSPEPQFFADLRQWSGGMPLFPTGAYYVVKTAGPAEDLMAQLRGLVRAIDADASLFNVARLDAILASTVTRPRLYAAVFGAFAILGALLSAIGLYGVLAFLVQQRTPELGIRLALGASRRAVIGLVLRQGGVLVGAGLGLGLFAGWIVDRALAGLLYGIEPGDPRTIAGAVALFAAVAAAALVVPARRATHVDPLAAIRRE
jgi:predicted permease